MTEAEKIALLEEIMDLEPGALHLDDRLDRFEEWDSVTALAYISELDGRFNKKLTGRELKAFTTVRDAIALME